MEEEEEREEVEKEEKKRCLFRRLTKLIFSLFSCPIQKTCLAPQPASRGGTLALRLQRTR